MGYLGSYYNIPKATFYLLKGPLRGTYNPTIWQHACMRGRLEVLVSGAAVLMTAHPNFRATCSLTTLSLEPSTLSPGPQALKPQPHVESTISKRLFKASVQPPPSWSIHFVFPSGMYGLMGASQTVFYNGTARKFMITLQFPFSLSQLLSVLLSL